MAAPQSPDEDWMPEGVAEANEDWMPDGVEEANADDPVGPPAAAAASPPQAPAPTGPSALERFAKWAQDKARSGVAGALSYASNNGADELAGLIGGRDDMLRAAKAGYAVPMPDFGDSYRARRDDYRDAEKGAREANPGAFHSTGLVAGLLSPSARVGAGWQGAVASGAINGALSGLGGSEAELSVDEGAEYGDAAVDTALGAGIGGAIGAGAYAVGANLPRFADYLRGRIAPASERRAVKGIMGQNAKAFRSMVDKDTLQDTGRTLLDYDITRAGRSVEEMRLAAAELQEQAGQTKADNLAVLDDALPYELRLLRDEMADSARRNVVAPMERMTSGDAAVARRLQADVDALRYGVGDSPNVPRTETVVDTVAERPISLTDADSFKSALDKFIRWDSVEPPPVQDGLRQLRGNINGQVESRIDDLVEANPGMAEFADRFRESKRVYGRMADVAVPAMNQQARETSNRLASPSDYGTGGVAALLASLASGGDLSTTAMMGGGALLANKVLRERGPQFFADYGNRLSKEGGPLSRLAGANVDSLATGAEALANPAVVAAAGGAANAVRPDFSNGPRARSKQPDNQSLFQTAFQNPAAFGKYADRLNRAAHGGPEAFALHDYLLAQSDPEYADMRRRALMEANGESQ